MAKIEKLAKNGLKTYSFSNTGKILKKTFLPLFFFQPIISICNFENFAYVLTVMINFNG